MLGPAFTFLVLFLHGRHSQAAASCLGPRPPDEAVVRRSGTSFHLGPSDTPPAVSSLEWKAQLRSEEGTRVLFTWRDGGSSEGERWGSGRHRLRLSTSRLSLLFEAAQQDDSGTYSLEVTSEAGAVRTHCFLVSVLDAVRQPELRLLEQRAAPGGRCRVTLNCSASGGGDVAYTWSRGGQAIPPPRSPFRLEEQTGAGGLHTYTCNASNAVSWASQSLQLGPGCGSAGHELSLLPLLMIILVPKLMLLGTLTCVCMWRRGRKPAEPGPQEALTVCEDARSPPIGSGQVRPEAGSRLPSFRTCPGSVALPSRGPRARCCL
ncbi:unnamed protein product [Pipistrellus nathusii]|uniref:Ig-like domain-containing protein n=1 Tax=Pipistrellus nathusii TaxID=59473 RepID=A0ABN9ZSP4_PIPNA